MHLIRTKDDIRDRIRSLLNPVNTKDNTKKLTQNI